MDDKEFQEIVKSLPSYQRLSFIHGERLFIRDADGYRIVSIQALYELASRPTGIIVTSEKLSKQHREALLAEADKYTPLIPRGRSGLVFDLGLPPQPVPPLVPCPLLELEYPERNDQDDALTDGQVWVAIGVMILIILIISFSAFPNP